MRNYFRIAMAFLLFFIAYSLQFTVYSSYAQDKIVAIVNNEIVTQKDLNDFLNFTRLQLRGEYKGEELESKIQSMKLDLLGRLIEDRIILQAAKKEGVKIDDSRVKARIDELKKPYNSDSEFQYTLNQQGLTQADIEAKIREQIYTYAIIEQKVRSKVVVNPFEVTDFYEKNSAGLDLPEGRRVRSLATENEGLANNIYGSLKKGEDFEALASKNSLTVDSMEVMRDGELRNDVEDAIFNLKPGGFSSPLKINDSFYIFKLETLIPPRKPTLSETQDRIYTILYNQKMQQGLSDWVDELKKQSYIKIL